MRNYLSYGGGVNSTAMLLFLLDEGWDFEAVYVDHGGDWPETRQFVRWLSRHTPITILKPVVEGAHSLYEYLWQRRMTPSMQRRFCTDKFKVRPFHTYCKATAAPAFELIGIDAGEIHRAKIRNAGGLESRYPLIEYGLDREDCKRLIRDHGIPVPPKSGCFFCPFQRVGQWRELRRRHPDLFCQAQQLEARNNEYRAEKGKKPWHLAGRPLADIVREDQGELFAEHAYPPCRCEL